MNRHLAISLALVGLCAAATPAHAGGKVLEYVIDHGTVGVIASASGKARLIVQANGNCRAIPYSVVADSVLAITGSFDLSKERVMPLDYTNVTLSCSEAGVKVKVEQPEKSGLGF
ncbi:MAG TPA: hypothetical protein VNI58_00670 [Mariprofundaceae bacterium]|nr:hypothetical protein [Mariprofundaceae bacterium]